MHQPVMIVTGGSRGIGAVVCQLGDRGAGGCRRGGGHSLFEAAGRFGRVGVLVNNAGIVDGDASVAELSAERLECMFRTGQRSLRPASR